MDEPTDLAVLAKLTQLFGIHGTNGIFEWLGYVW